MQIAKMSGTLTKLHCVHRFKSRKLRALCDVQIVKNAQREGGGGSVSLKAVISLSLLWISCLYIFENIWGFPSFIQTLHFLWGHDLPITKGGMHTVKKNNFIQIKIRTREVKYQIISNYQLKSATLFLPNVEIFGLVLNWRYFRTVYKVPPFTLW
jgi:hypothetical protein